jgi:NitT/TauT family transport system substrate-binding protein
MTRRLLLTALLVAWALPAHAQQKDYGTLKMAIQFGTSYTPAVLVWDLGLLEKRLPGIKIEQVQLGGGGVITQAMLAGQVDIGFMGLGPLIVGWAKGVPWKVAVAMQDMPIDMNTNRPDVKSLKDIRPTDKIALPGINSIQHVVLAMAAERQLGNARAFDQNLVPMAHPDGERALYAKGEITFHYTSPPFQERERQQPGITQVLDSYEVLGGPHTFNVAAVTKDFYEKRREVYDAFVDAMAEAITIVKEDPKRAAEVMQKRGLKGTTEEIVASMKDPRVNWTIEPHGLMKFATFMKKAGFIDKAPSDWKELTWPNLHNLKGS